MSSLLLTEMRRTYAAQRGVSQGAAITLAAVSGGFSARFECADRCVEILGARLYEDSSTLTTPSILIPLEDAHRSLAKLAETYSVALVDTVTDDQGTRFVLVWKIVPTSKRVQEETLLAELSAVESNQGEMNLDEY